VVKMPMNAIRHTWGIKSAIKCINIVNIFLGDLQATANLSALHSHREKSDKNK
jgi:hypothetical protein